MCSHHGGAGREGGVGVSTVFFVRLKKKQVVTSRPVLGDVFLFKHTQYSVSFR